jgi:hypothetical protein
LPTYEVEVRGSTDLGELGSLKLEAAKDLAPHSFESGTPQEAAARAVAELTPRTAPLLVYVRDEAGGVTIFWPSGEPLTYSRRDASGIGEGYCFVQVARGECVGRGAPQDQTAIFVDGSVFDSGWVCDPCAAVVAPGL